MDDCQYLDLTNLEKKNPKKKTMDPCTQKEEFIVFQKYFARDKAA
jgi:hypothetical protein